jgi:hypothetical protein
MKRMIATICLSLAATAAAWSAAAAPSDRHRDPWVVTEIAAANSQAVMMPSGNFLLDARYERQHDALMVVAGQDRYLVTGFFADENGPALVTADGKLLPHDLVRTLAAASTAVRYAQAGATQAAGLVRIGQVEKLAGSVIATHVNGGKDKLATGSPVYQKDVLETSKDGAVAIKFADGTNFSLGGDARMVLDELIYNPNAKSGSAVMSVLKGTFVFVTGEVASSAPDAMKVRTPSGTLGIRGTVAGCADGARYVCTLLPAADRSGGHVVAFERRYDGQSERILLVNALDSVVIGAANGPSQQLRLTPDEASALYAPALIGSAFDYLKASNFR